MREEAPIIDLKLGSEFTKCRIYQIYNKNIGKASHFFGNLEYWQFHIPGQLRINILSHARTNKAIKFH